MTELFPGIDPKPLSDEDLRLLSYLKISEDKLEPTKERPTGETGIWKCRDCDTSEHIRTENDTVLCTHCGEVFEHILDQGPEYRWFTGEDRNPDPTRVGAPQNPLLPESSLGTTMILRKNHGNAMRKIKRYHTWNLMPYRERNLWSIFEGLHVRAINAGIGLGVLEEAKRLYAQLSSLCVCRGTQKEALLAACLYESLKRARTPRRPKDIGIIFQINIHYVTRGLKQFANLLDMDKRLAKEEIVPQVTDEPVEIKPKEVTVESRRAKWDTLSCSTTTFEHYIDPFVSKLDAPRHLMGTLIILTRQICKRADDMGICPENTPPSLTAAALALGCGALNIQKTTPEIATVCDISVVTLHKCLKRLDSWKQKLLESN
jgi:transcription initiation factor TFIIB